MVFVMKRTPFYLWTVLRDRAGLDEAAIAELAGHTARELDRNDPAPRHSDMEAAIGLWAERDDLPDTESYLRNLREDCRAESLQPA
jgi:hypothetical protein